MIQWPDQHIASLVDFTTPSPFRQDISSYLVSGWSVSEYLRYTKYGRLVVVEIGGLSANNTGAQGFLNTNAIPIAKSRPLGSAVSDSANDSCLIYGHIDGTTLTIATHRANIKYYCTLIYFTE